MPLIIPADDHHAIQIARDLLDNADSAAEVTTETTEGRTSFRVSDALARKVGYVDSDTPADDADDFRVYPDPEYPTAYSEAPATTVQTYPGGGGGAAPVVELDKGDTAPAAEAAPGAVEPPARNESKAEWAAWLDAQKPPIEYPADARRDELIALWDARQ